MTNSAVELGMDDAEVAALIRGAFRRVERVLRARLVEARRDGHLAVGTQPAVQARLLIAVLQGIRVMAKVGVDRAAMRDAVNCALAGIGADAGRRRSGHTIAARRIERLQGAKKRAVRLRVFA